MMDRPIVPILLIFGVALSSLGLGLAPVANATSVNPKEFLITFAPDPRFSSYYSPDPCSGQGIVSAEEIGTSITVEWLYKLTFVRTYPQPQVPEPDPCPHTPAFYSQAFETWQDLIHNGGCVSGVWNEEQFCMNNIIGWPGPELNFRTGTDDPIGSYDIGSEGGYSVIEVNHEVDTCDPPGGVGAFADGIGACAGLGTCNPPSSVGATVNGIGLECESVPPTVGTCDPPNSVGARVNDINGCESTVGLQDDVIAADQTIVAEENSVTRCTPYAACVDPEFGSQSASGQYAALALGTSTTQSSGATSQGAAIATSGTASGAAAYGTFGGAGSLVGASLLGPASCSASDCVAVAGTGSATASSGCLAEVSATGTATSSGSPCVLALSGGSLLGKVLP